MASQDPEIRKRVLGNMRAGERERLRNLVLAQAASTGEVLSENEIGQRLADLEREKLSRAGAAGARTYAQRAEAQRQFLAEKDDLVAELEAVLARLKGMGVAA